MKKLTIIVVATGFAMACVAQDANTSQPGSVSTSVIGSRTNATQTSSVVGSTNGAPSVDQLAIQLQSLRSSVEQTLPVLTAFNQQAGATASTNGLGGALSGLISGIFGKNSNSASSATSGQRLTNVLSALGALVSTNSQGTVSIDSATLQNLAALEKDLQPVAQVMRNLNLGSTNQVTPTQGTPGGLTPTGR